MPDPPVPAAPSGSVPPAPAPAGARPDLGVTATGLDPRFAAMLAYLIGWVTGLLLLFLERDNRYVRFHAAQSLVALGTLWALGIAFWVLGFLAVFASAGAFRVLMWMAELVWIAGAILWLVCLYKAYAGERWKAPVAGDIAERVAAPRRT